jgi:hypothetical protein
MPNAQWPMQRSDANAQCNAQMQMLNAKLKCKMANANGPIQLVNSKGSIKCSILHAQRLCWCVVGPGGLPPSSRMAR